MNTKQRPFSQNMVAGFNDRNDWIVGRWYKSYYPGIENKVRQLTNGSPDTPDLASDVILAVLHCEDSFKSIKSIEKCIETITGRICQAHLKTMKKREGKEWAVTEHIMKLEYNDTKNATARDLVSELQYLAIEMLPPQCNRVFQLYYKDGMKNREIAERLNISEKAVEAQKTLAFKKLRIKIIDLYGGGREMFLIILSFPLFIIYLLMQKLFL